MAKQVPARNGGTLTRPEKGESMNPNGRPKGKLSRSTIAKRILMLESAIPKELFEKLKELYPEISNQMCIEEVATLVQAHKAITKQDTAAYVALLDSAYGKAAQEIDVTTDGKEIQGNTPIILTRQDVEALNKDFESKF